MQLQQAAEASQNAKTNQLARFLFLIPVALLVATLLAWDKVICKFMADETRASSVCTTDPISNNEWWIIMAVICFYYLTTPKKG